MAKKNLLSFINFKDGTFMLALGLLGGVAASYYFSETINPISKQVFGYIDPYIPGTQPSEIATGQAPAPAVPSAVPGAVTGATIAAANYADEYIGDDGIEYGYSDYDENDAYYPEEEEFY